MALQYSPKIVTDNLVMCLDASQNKSFPSTTLHVKQNLTLWLDASDSTTFTFSTGSVISQWRDKSGNNNHAGANGANATPTRGLYNSRNAALFVRSSTQSLSCGSMSSLEGIPEITVICVGYTTADNSIFVAKHAGGTGGSWYVARINSTTGRWMTINGSASRVDQAFSATLGSLSIVSTQYQSSISTQSTYVTGTSTGTASQTGLLQSAGQALLIGNYAGNDWALNGAIHEILIYTRALTLKELKLIHTYLGLKWGLLNTDRNWHDLISTNDSPLGNGTTANMPRFDYYNGGSLAFDGVNDYININSGAAINGFNPDGSGAGRSRTSVNLWFKPSSVNTANTNKMIFSDNCSPEFSLHQYNNLVYAYSYAGVSATIEADKWYNACWVSDAGAPSSATTTYVTFYLNGDLVGSTSTGTGNGLNDTEFNLGRDACTAGTYFSGSIGLVQLYSRDLTAAEVKQLYQVHRSRYVQTLVQGGLTLNVDAGNPYSYTGVGFDWYDVSGNSYICTLINGPTYSNGAIVFDGTNDFVDLTYPYSVSIAASGNAARSMFVWIKTTYTSNQAFISTGTAANSQSFNLVKYGSYIGVMGYNNDYYPSTGNAGILITDGVWHYIGVTFDGTNLRMYVDGILDNTSGTLTYSTTGQNNFIGKSSHTGNENYTNGSMGMVHVYNRALSGAEVLQNYNATKGRFGR